MEKKYEVKEYNGKIIVPDEVAGKHKYFAIELEEKVDIKEIIKICSQLSKEFKLYVE